MSRRPSNFSLGENDERAEAYFVDAREKPGSMIPSTSINSISTGSEHDLARMKR